mmetsp:Transcript_121075/g.210589  ORF Transcript_121075/g.210589 Transcript_121075/m.210589 type:complete len:147 (-) Transcript_121075:495-935(-)
MWGFAMGTSNPPQACQYSCADCLLYTHNQNHSFMCNTNVISCLVGTHTLAGFFATCANNGSSCGTYQGSSSSSCTDAQSQCCIEIHIPNILADVVQAIIEVNQSLESKCFDCTCQCSKHNIRMDGHCTPISPAVQLHKVHPPISGV